MFSYLYIQTSGYFVQIQILCIISCCTIFVSVLESHFYCHLQQSIHYHFFQFQNLSELIESKQLIFSNLFVSCLLYLQLTKQSSTSYILKRALYWVMVCSTKLFETTFRFFENRMKPKSFG